MADREVAAGGTEAVEEVRVVEDAAGAEEGGMAVAAGTVVETGLEVSREGVVALGKQEGMQEVVSREG